MMDRVDRVVPGYIFLNEKQSLSSLLWLAVGYRTQEREREREKNRIDRNY